MVTITVVSGSVVVSASVVVIAKFTGEVISGVTSVSSSFSSGTAGSLVGSWMVSGIPTFVKSLSAYCFGVVSLAGGMISGVYLFVGS